MDTALMQCKHKGTMLLGKVKGSHVSTQYGVDCVKKNRSVAAPSLEF